MHAAGDGIGNSLSANGLPLVEWKEITLGPIGKSPLRNYPGTWVRRAWPRERGPASRRTWLQLGARCGLQTNMGATRPEIFHLVREWSNKTSKPTGKPVQGKRSFMTVWLQRWLHFTAEGKHVSTRFCRQHNSTPTRLPLAPGTLQLLDSPRPLLLIGAKLLGLSAGISVQPCYRAPQTFQEIRPGF